MLGRLCTVGVLVVVMGAAAVLSAIPGPNDRRFPDYIVDPRVTCEKEGSFPHPRNCSWYYRCVDRMNLGMYWTYYFECEPGTVFSDELDQCVHPSIAEPPCGKPSPPTEPPIITCVGVEGTCTTYDVCKPSKMRKVLCEKLQCPLRTPYLQCDPGFFFDMSSRKCVLPPRPQNLCGSVVDTDISISETGKLACSFENPRPPSDFIFNVYCSKFPICSGETFLETKFLCRKYYECYREGNSWKASLQTCPLGLLFSYDLDRCVPEPTEDETCK